MAVETIDGTVRGATVRRSNAKVALYESVVFNRDDGSEHRLNKVAVAPAVAAMLQPGVQGRFYTYSAIDHNGVVAARTRDGRSAYVIPSGNERIFMIAAIVGVAWSVIRLATGGVPWLALVLGIGGSVGWFVYRRTRIETRARYEADSGYA